MYGKAMIGVLLIVAVCALAVAQTEQLTSSVCTFDDGRQISVQYHPAVADRHKLPEGKLWSPGHSPMFFFASTPLEIENSQVPTGAYSMYVIPQRDNWTLVLNKNVTAGSQYDEKLDVLRVPMQSGQINTQQEFKIFFAHVAPKQCNIRIYQGKTGVWAELKEK